jgi:hypothetical protein
MSCSSPWTRAVNERSPCSAFPQVRGYILLVGDTGFEPVTSSVSGKRATTAPIAHCEVVEVGTGFEPVYTDLQSVASPLGQPTVTARPPTTYSERTTRLELATSTLARLRSTN